MMDKNTIMQRLKESKHDALRVGPWVLLKCSTFSQITHSGASGRLKFYDLADAALAFSWVASEDQTKPAIVKGAFWDKSGRELFDDFVVSEIDDIFEYFEEFEHQDGYLNPESKLECMKILLA